MSRSTKLVTATYIASYIAVEAPRKVTTGDIARKMQEHPSRVRTIVGSLIKGGLLTASRGGGGKVTLARPPEQITLRDIYDAIQDQPLLSLSIGEPDAEWGGECLVRPIFTRLYSDLERRMRDDLSRYRLDQMYVRPSSSGDK
jgi:DNA-binding IscR family transcriptional regulator